MKSIILMYIICYSLFCIGQNILPPPEVSSLKEDTVILENDIIIGERNSEPQFPGGTQALLQYMRQQFDWNCVNVQDSLLMQSKMYLSFLVKVDGSIMSVSTERVIDEFIDQCCFNFIENMPKWNPARDIDGKPMEMRIRLPITICLN
jgi:hypothetical protein